MGSTVRSIISSLRSNWIWLLAIVAIAAAAQFATNTDESAVSLQEFSDKISAGRPVVVEFFSPT